MYSTLELLIPILGILVGGAVVLTPILALSARYALKPALEAFAHYKETQAGNGGAILQDRRIELLEAELQALQSTVQRIAEADDFQRRLNGTAGEPAQQNQPSSRPVAAVRS